jgi:adenylate cyclase
VKYAVVGSNVNLAGRIESFSVGGQLLITESTLNATSLKVRIKNKLSIPFKGLAAPVNIYDVMGISGAYEISLPTFDSALVALVDEIPISFEIVDAKYSSGQKFFGSVTELAGAAAIFSSEVELQELTNLKIDCGDMLEELIIYAKVICVNRNKLFCYEIRFTSISPEAGKYLENLLKNQAISEAY